MGNQDTGHCALLHLAVNKNLKLMHPIIENLLAHSIPHCFAANKRYIAQDHHVDQRCPGGYDAMGRKEYAGACKEERRSLVLWETSVCGEDKGSVRDDGWPHP